MPTIVHTERVQRSAEHCFDVVIRHNRENHPRWEPEVLEIREVTGGPIRLTWSDGRRTLTWSPGVQIMWMAADVHRMCGRAGHHH